MMQQLAKKWFIKCIVTLLILLTMAALVMIIVDPYFHYHKPLSFLSYRLYEERYINDGISRNFDFDAIITGTSMTQNFKPSELDALFGTHAVKEAFSGAGFQELSGNLERALKRNSGLKTVVMGVDYNGLLRSYDWVEYEEYPDYLYDDNVLNDVSYLFNKSIFYHGVLPSLSMTLKKESPTTMDEYSSWERTTGLEHILASYDREDMKTDPNPQFSETDRQMVTDTININIVRLVNQYPDTEFYLFYTPYSILYWDALHLQGILPKQLAAEQIATELLLQCPNVKLYNFFDQRDVICNTDYYNDIGHYSAEINSKILQWMAEDEGLITKDNYLEKLAQEEKFFLNYDYEAIYQ